MPRYKIGTSDAMNLYLSNARTLEGAKREAAKLAGPGRKGEVFEVVGTPEGPSRERVAVVEGR